MNAVLKIVLVVMASSFLLITTGCTKTKLKQTGFLSDYSRLQSADDSLRYLDMKRLAQYKQFIVEPVVIHLHGMKQGARPDPEMRRELANYMNNAIVKAIQGKYMIVSQPGPGVAKVRVAITDIEQSNPVLNAIPQAKLTGAGLGSASMEGELLDSQTGEQIAALIESQKGSRLSFSGLKKWGDAKAVMDGWAERFRKRLDEAHGN
jgi:hypothetical protein